MLNFFDQNHLGGLIFLNYREHLPSFFDESFFINTQTLSTTKSLLLKGVVQFDVTKTTAITILVH